MLAPARQTTRIGATARKAPRVVPVVVLAAGIAGLIAWALRAHAEFLPSGREAPHLSGHSHGTAVYVPPPPVAGEAVANYAGLIMVALHVLLAGVALTAWGVRRWLARPHGLLAQVVFAGAVSVASALVTVVMAAVLLDTAISSGATVAAAVSVARYAFVLAVVSSTVLGLP
jgi:hypothetical protein